MQSPSPTTTPSPSPLHNLNLIHNFPSKLTPLHFRPKLPNHRISKPMTSTFTRLFKINSKTESNSDAFVTVTEFAGKAGEDVGDDLVVLYSHLEYAFKKIAALVASPVNSSLGKSDGDGGDVGAGRDKPKPLDIVSNEIILSCLRNSGKVAVMASEEDDAPVWITDDGPFVVVTDPLDGSRNIDASIPTGTIFGIYNRLIELDSLPVEEKAMLNSLQSGGRLIAAGYVLYSSATILCTSFGSGAHAFTLDRLTGDFVLTHPNIKIPPRGQIYSVNDARYFDWPEGLRRYIDTIRQGKGKFPKKYSARYICSLVADFHRTLMYGGVAMNPRDHLRLVYEANPLSFLAEQAGGKGSDGKHRLLSIQPVKFSDARKRQGGAVPRPRNSQGTETCTGTEGNVSRPILDRFEKSNDVSAAVSLFGDRFFKVFRSPRVVLVSFQGLSCSVLYWSPEVILWWSSEN